MADTKKVLIWVGAGCGTLFLLVVATCVGGAIYVKHRAVAELAKKDPNLAEAVEKGGLLGGLQAGGGQMVASGVAIYGSTALAAALPKGEQKPNLAIMEHLVKVGAQLKQEDIQALGQAMDRVQKAHKDGKTPATAEEARAFFAEVKVVANKYQQ